MIIADTSGLLALFSESGRNHESVVAWVKKHNPVLVVSPFVIVEVDYLVATRKGVEAELTVLRELTGGAYDLPVMTPHDLILAIDLVERYRDLRIGIVDASLVVLADRYRTSTILTLDRRHFMAVRSLDGGHFTIVP